MIREKKLAIVIPFAGEFEFLDETISSILNANKGLTEVVIGIDETKVLSNDATKYLEKFFNQFASKNILLKIVSSKKGGPSAVRNEAIKATNCDIILPVDSDDKIASTYPMRIVDFYNNDVNDEFGIFYGKAERFGLVHGVWDLPKFKLSEFVLENCIYATAGFYKADWLLVGGYDEDLVHGQEDWDLWLKILGLGKRVFYSEGETVFYYRIRNGSRSQKFSGMWEQVIWTYDKICQNNMLIMSENINSIYHRRMTLELENTSLRNISLSLIQNLLRKYPKIRTMLQHRIFFKLKNRFIK